MILFALAVGFFAQLIFFLGIAGLLYTYIIALLSIFYWLIWSFVIIRHAHFAAVFWRRLTGIEWLFVGLIGVLCFINVLGALSPELGFDALWYHLTLPKLYLLHHQIWHIPGSLLYYSDMPKLAELLYTVLLAVTNETLPKLLQFSVGIFTLVFIYRVSSIFTNRFYAFFACLLFYSNLVVDWESTTAYVDLLRTFFEAGALVAFICWQQRDKKKYFYIAAILTGFAIETKLLALGTLAIFLCLLIYVGRGKESLATTCRKIFLFTVLSLLMPLPWFVFSYLHTGNPVYPFFSSLYHVTLNLSLLSPLQFISQITFVLTKADDPISPLYLVFLPLLLMLWRHLPSNAKPLYIYCALALIVWYISPRTGGGRFLLPYLPAFSITVSSCLFTLEKRTQEGKTYYKSVVLMLVLLIAFSSIIYRSAAEWKFLPALFGQQTKQEFLTRNLNFSFGDFYDTDGYFSTHIHKNDKVLLIGFHNLFYVNFPFVDVSWMSKNERFTYIAVQNSPLPRQYDNWRQVYENNVTHVRLYVLK